MHHIHPVTFTDFQHRKASFAAKMYCTCVGQCKEDAQRHGRGGICGWRLLCHRRSPHRLPLLDTLPPLSSATYLPPALDQLLPMQRFYNGTLSNYWMGCLTILYVYMSLLQVVFCVHHSLCTQLLACSVCAWERATVYGG